MRISPGHLDQNPRLSYLLNANRIFLLHNLAYFAADIRFPTKKTLLSHRILCGIMSFPLPSSPSGKFRGHYFYQMIDFCSMFLYVVRQDDFILHPRMSYHTTLVIGESLGRKEAARMYVMFVLCWSLLLWLPKI